MKYLCTFFLILLCFCSYSQSNAKVKLIKGSIFKGEVLKYQYGDTLYLKIDAVNIIRIPENRIKTLTYLDGLASPMTNYHSKKMINSSRFALDAGQTGKGFSVSHTTYFKIISNLYAGIGLAVDNYYNSEDFNVYPVFAATRYYFVNKKISPFVDMRFGYGLAFKNLSHNLSEANGGLHLNPSFGYRFGSHKFHTELTLGLKFQHAEYVYLISDRTTSYDVLSKRLNIGLNFTF